ncbi:hypothetical protein [Nocardioides sp. CFH 31398]|uniref:hypothetical protein n=1 Tax=Nocardioides sp. CFH 31398 TaxID=2919579 RepID=UPI001F05F517|nr:hypothetical protein [Nocardioides sp. CFH 31398]MCH1866710.1 hypothetical protein [Nocardioides sp. CFH 31398]
MPGGTFCSDCGTRLSRPYGPCERCGAGAVTHLSPDSGSSRYPWDQATTARGWGDTDGGGSRPPYGEPLPPSRGGRGPRASLMVPLVLLLVLAGVAAGLVVGFGVLDDGDGEQQAGSAQRADRAERGGPRRGAARQGGQGTAELRFTCWTGNPAVSERACPAGPNDSRQGFGWVFPRVDFERCRRMTSVNRTLRSCELDGTRVNFSLWNDLEEARSHYLSDFGVDPEVMPAGRVKWDSVGADFGEGEYKSAVMYADHPWSMTVYATSREAVSPVVYRYWMRAAGELRGAEAP